MSIKGALVALLASAAFAAPAAANVQVGSSGWQWGNPLPQGNTLRAIAFAGTTGYAAGDFGTLLKTADGGTTWTGLPVGTFQGLSVVQALDANTVVAGGGCVARRSTDGGATFTAISFAAVETSCRAALRDMSFVSATLGFLLLDDGSVLTTSDGGTHFAPRTAVPGTRAIGGSADPRSIVFTGPATGYAATSEGKIFQTLDAGNSWKLVAGPGAAINQLWFLDPTHGFAVGNGGLFLRSVDGGASWTPKSLDAGFPSYSSIRCASTLLCILSTSNGAQLVRTTDAGDTPGTVITPATDPIYAAAFASGTRVSAVGANGTTVRSDDAGATFAPVGGRLTGSFLGLRAGGAAGTAFAFGTAGALAKTLDSGRTWARSNVGTSAFVRDVSFPTATAGFALDGDGGVFATTDGGTFWKTLGTGSTQHARALYAPSADVVVLVGPRGIRRSTDGGGTFDPVAARAVSRAQLFGVTATRGAIFAWGSSTVLRSTNRGSSWTTLVKPGATASARRRLSVVQVAFSSASTGLLVDGRGRVWRTTTAGRKWSVLPGVGTESISGVATGSAREAYLITGQFGARSGGYLLHTVDGGATWQPQFVVDSAIPPSGIATPGGGVDYLLAGQAALLASTTGGSAGNRSTLTLATRKRRLTKATSITVTGRLGPAGSGGEQVVVSALAPGATLWRHQTVTVASNGSFASRWPVKRGTTTFVAQWTGDFKSAGAGSPVMTVTVAPKPKRRH